MKVPVRGGRLNPDSVATATASPRLPPLTPLVPASRNIHNIGTTDTLNFVV